MRPHFHVIAAAWKGSALLYYAKKLALDAAMEDQGERYAWAAHLPVEMGKALINDVGWGMGMREELL